MPLQKIVWDKQDIVKCDDRGRAHLGSEFKDQQVHIYICELPEVEDCMRPSEPEQEILNLMVSWAENNVDDWFDLDPQTGEVIDKYGDEHQSPYKLS